MRKFLSSVVIILVLFSGIGISLHHHDDGLPHDDCPTCVTASHRQSITSDRSPEVKSHDVLLVTIHLPGIPADSSPFTANLNVRSPPASL